MLRPFVAAQGPVRSAPPQTTEEGLGEPRESGSRVEAGKGPRPQRRRAEEEKENDGEDSTAGNLPSRVQPRGNDGEDSTAGNLPSRVQLKKNATNHQLGNDTDGKVKHATSHQPTKGKVARLGSNGPRECSPARDKRSIEVPDSGTTRTGDCHRRVAALKKKGNDKEESKKVWKIARLGGQYPRECSPKRDERCIEVSDSDTTRDGEDSTAGQQGPSRVQPQKKEEGEESQRWPSAAGQPSRVSLTASRREAAAQQRRPAVRPRGEATETRGAPAPARGQRGLRGGESGR